MYTDTDNKRVHELQGAIRLAKDRIKRLEKEREDRIIQIREGSQISIDAEPISLNLVKII